ncbi:MAG: ABC transporter ATP-binding protein/permease [Lachnospiraceae bacterium]|nr:ABC transporter ATP-binding protein/permease [Lachnospiraceae bacterium]
MKKKNSAMKKVAETLAFFYPQVFQKYKGYFFVGALKTLIDAAAPFVSILVLPLLIDGLINGEEKTLLLFYAAVIALGGTFLNLIASVLGVTMEKYDQKFQNHFSEELSRKVMDLDFQLTEDKKALDQIEAARTGMSWYSGGVHGISQSFFGIVTDLITILGVVVLIALHAPLLFVLLAVLLLVIAVINSKNNKIEAEEYAGLSKFNRIFSYLGWEIVDFRYGKDIRLYSAQDMLVGKWEFYTNGTLKRWENKANRQLPLTLSVTAVSIIRTLTIYFYLGVRVILGKITIGIFSQMCEAGNTLNNSVGNLIWRVQDIIKKTNYAYEYIVLMRYPVAIEKGERHVADKPHTIEFKNVDFTYPNTEVQVLKNVSLTLSAGEHLSVVGLNGAGKTTFVKLLCRLYDPTAGEILLDGVNISEYDYKEYMQLFSPVFQDFKLFAFSMKENIVLGDDVEKEAVLPLVGQVGLEEKVSSLEKGLDTMLFKFYEEDGIEPSGGEQQKLAIARALYKKAPVVILDEPTAALDPVAEYDIYRQFEELVGGKTAVYISHRLSSCKFCDRIAVFSDGRVAEYGTHDELLKLGGIYAEMFAAQAQYYR